MLRLIRVTQRQAETLFELATILNPDETLLGGLRFACVNIKESGLNDLSCDTETFNKIRHLVVSPFMPADAARYGIPTDRYLQIVEDTTILKDQFINPRFTTQEFVDKEFKQKFLN